ncbi:MAG: hypothetical protein ACYDCO_03590 [Armatimonadota bacterium]
MAMKSLIVGGCLCALLLMLAGCGKKAAAPVGPVNPGSPAPAAAPSTTAPDAASVTPPPDDMGGAPAATDAAPAADGGTPKVGGSGTATTTGLPAPPPGVQKALDEGKDAGAAAIQINPNGK